MSAGEEAEVQPAVVIIVPGIVGVSVRVRKSKRCYLLNNLQAQTIFSFPFFSVIPLHRFLVYPRFRSLSSTSSRKSNSSKQLSRTYYFYGCPLSLHARSSPLFIILFCTIESHLPFITQKRYPTISAPSTLCRSSNYPSSMEPRKCNNIN